MTVTDDGETLCEYCRLNAIIPDVAIESNMAMWRRLEQAKHRVLNGMRSAGFDVSDGSADEHVVPLRFEFRSSANEVVTTGHANGVITLRLEEGDPVERERLRRELGEPKRTLTAHFRHELGHYIWQTRVEPGSLYEFRDVFGHEEKPSYADAKDAYYASGPVDDWEAEFVSAYASMHPWEDFAESFRVYLEMDAMLRTANGFGLAPAVAPCMEDRLAQFLELAVASNELSRELGVVDRVPERFSEPVLQKLTFIDSLSRIKSAQLLET